MCRLSSNCAAEFSLEVVWVGLFVWPFHFWCNCCVCKAALTGVLPNKFCHACEIVLVSFNHFRCFSGQSPFAAYFLCRYKSNRNCIAPHQPSEASAHFMFELAKTVRLKAGGNSSTSLFVKELPGLDTAETHRALHLCAFQIGLYALGLNNRVSPNWHSRTYSLHVSWIKGLTAAFS